ncbi:MAG: ImmA/IrrE family metallo-endopeptidase [Heliobacteriaceae bacterium]|nr:ImmA/IrrE family metallo-endopeptidase [Heliobacteriaceae bacterium]
MANENGIILRDAIDLLAKENDPIWIKLVQLAENRGIRVLLANKIAKNTTGLYIRTKDGRKIIALKDSLVSNERRETMAHELAHAVLHSGKKDYNICLYFEGGKYWECLENEANNFARRLLRFLDRRY